MPTYVDKVALLSALKEKNDITFYGIQIVNRFPAADVAPVVHGTWDEKIVDDPDDKHGFLRRRFYCSACGQWNCYGKTDYCMHCGAEMEKEEKE